MLGKSRNIVLFQRFVGPEGRRVGLLKRRVRSHVKNLHAAVARSTFTFASQNVKKLPGSEHFPKLRCGKIVRGCGEKHISKSKR